MSVIGLHLSQPDGMFDLYPRAFLELKYDLMVSSSYDLNFRLES